MTHRDRICRAPRSRLASSLFLAGCLLLFGLLIRGCASLPLMPWHTESLTAEFTARQTDEVRNFEDYLQLEDRLFAELEEKIVAGTETGPAHALVRFSEGSFANPKSRAVNWNRSFEFPAAAEYRKDKRPPGSPLNRSISTVGSLDVAPGWADGRTSAEAWVATPGVARLR